MTEPRWIQGFLFLILQLQVTSYIIGSYNEPSVLKRVGDKVLLSCQSVEGSQQNHKSTTWIFTASRAAAPVELVKLGEMGENSRNKSSRLSVTAAGSLVIRKVAVEDAGRYKCLQIKSGNEQKTSAVVDLSVVHITKQREDQMVIFNCSVLTFDQCKYKVKWDYYRADFLTGSEGNCFGILTYYGFYSELSRDTCEITFEEVHVYAYNSASPAEAEATEEINSDPTTKSCDHWRTYQVIKIIIVSVGLAALSVTVLVVHTWTRIKGNKTRTNKNKVQSDEDDDDDEL